MAVKLTSLKADVKKENEGAWVPFADTGDPDLGFKVRSLNYVPFETARLREIMRLQTRFGASSVPQEESDQMLGKLLVEHILLDWRGIVDENRVAVPYTTDMGMDFLPSPEGVHVRRYVLACASRLGEVKAEFVEEAVKNSVPPSAKN